MPKASNRLLNEHETARRLGLRASTLRRWRWAEKGPRYLKVGGAVRYDPADIAAYLEEARRRSEHDAGSADLPSEVGHE